MNDAYGRLRERLDDFASGYPTTKGGIEIKIYAYAFSSGFFLPISFL